MLKMLNQLNLRVNDLNHSLISLLKRCSFFFLKGLQCVLALHIAKTISCSFTGCAFLEDEGC